MISLVPQNEPKQALNLDALTEEQRQKLRAERFKSGAQSSTEAFSRMAAEKDKIMQRALRFGVENPDANAERLKKRAERFGIETKESLE